MSGSAPPPRATARIEGHAGRAAPDVLLAPLSGRPCVWWDFRISIKETDSRGNSKWSQLESATSVTPFALADLDGRCLVGPVGAEVTPTDTDTWYGDTPRPVAGPPQHGWIGSLDHTYRYTERLIAPGTRLSVLGGAALARRRARGRWRRALAAGHLEG